MSEATTDEQKRALLMNSGISPRYLQERVSAYIPECVPLSDTPRKWIKARQHVIVLDETDKSAYVFCARLVACRKIDVFAVDAAMLVYYLEQGDKEKLALVYSCDVLAVLSFCSDYKCPFSPYQVRLLEGFLNTCVNYYDKNLILRATSLDMKWYSNDFQKLILPNSITANAEK